MIKSLAKLLNEENLGFIVDVGYPGEDKEGIFLLDTYSKGISLHSREDSIQIIIQVIKPYLEIKDLTKRVITIIKEKTEAYEVNSRYIGSYQSKQTFSINLKIGGTD